MPTHRTELDCQSSRARIDSNLLTERCAGARTAGGLDAHEASGHQPTWLTAFRTQQRRLHSGIPAQVVAGRITTVKRLAILVIFSFIVMPQAAAFKGLILSPSAKRLADEVIEVLFDLSKKTGGVKEIGKFLGKMNLPDEVLEDTFLRIAFRKEIVTREEAIGMFSRLSGVRGFRPTLRKMIGNNSSVTKGQLNELKIADEAHQSGFRLRQINERFSDGMKRRDTDIDIVLEKNGKTFAVEAKDYEPWAEISMIDFRRDLNTLVAYRSSQPENVVPVFSMTNRPVNSRTLTMLKNEARERNIELIFGSPRAQAIQFKQLEAVL